MDAEVKITATQLARSLSDVLNRILYRQERFVIERNGRPLASLTPIRSVTPINVEDWARRLSNTMVPDDGFADELEEIQKTQAAVETLEWPS